MFINLFICQYNIFKGEKIQFKKGNLDTTKECIKAFSKATKYFIFGGFSKLLLKKKSDKEIKIDTKEKEIDLLSKEYFENNDFAKQDFKDKIIFIVKNKNPNANIKGYYYELDITKEALENGKV